MATDFHLRFPLIETLDSAKSNTRTGASDPLPPDLSTSSTPKRSHRDNPRQVCEIFNGNSTGDIPARID